MQRYICSNPACEHIFYYVPHNLVSDITNHPSFELGPKDYSGYVPDDRI
jgi:hypothetical protein